MHQFADEAIILNLNNETYYSLNGSAVRIWEILSSTQSIEKTREQMLTEYDVSAEELERDLKDIIDTLKELSIIQVVEA